VTYRLEVHSTADDPKRYRTDERSNSGSSAIRFPASRNTSSTGACSPTKKVQALEEDQKRDQGGGESDGRADERAEQRSREHVRAPVRELPPYLEAQKRELAQELARLEETHGKLNMVQALNLALQQEMKKDDRVLVLGQDIGVDGGVFRVTEACSTSLRSG
jgi:hypothetical protein